MKDRNEKIPDPKELEKEIGEFLTKKFGDSVKIVSPIVLPQEAAQEGDGKTIKNMNKVNFDLTPEQLISYLDQYIVKQDDAKAVLATKICTHFNRINCYQPSSDAYDMVGNIKSNILMIGPTGVGKTYMVKLIAKKIGVPFVKGDATKFSETGYVGGDVEDLVRDLVREANDDIELAQCGIIYIDEIDKIASSRNLIGSDVSRTGVQRALLKPMEETDVELKVPHDPISMIQEIEQFRKSGKREKRVVNTQNILFIMSGAFSEINPIIKKRLSQQSIGFGSKITRNEEQYNILNQIRSEDLIQFGFESEFVGRLPIRAVFETLTENDLFDILKNPNNPIILGKKLDFGAYGIDIKFRDDALRILAKHAFEENTGARGLVSSIEKALLLYESKLPSTAIKKFSISEPIISKQETSIQNLLSSLSDNSQDELFKQISQDEKTYIKDYILSNRKNLEDKFNLTLSPSRIDIVSSYYCNHITDIGTSIKKVKIYYDDVKKIELYFFNKQDINIVLEDDAIDFIIEQLINDFIGNIEKIQEKLFEDFEHGLKLIKEKTGKNRFFITREALLKPDTFISDSLKEELNKNNN